MSVPRFSESRSAAIRNGLVAEVASTRRTTRRRGWMNVAVFAVSGALVGGAVSGAAWAASSARDAAPVQLGDVQNTGVPAPEGVTPGTPIVSLLAGGGSVYVDAVREIPLDPPAGATHVRVTVTCLAPGGLTWGLNAAGDNPRIGCGARDAEIASPGWFDFDFAEGRTLYLGSVSGAFTVGWQYLNLVETAWGLTLDGETYGEAKPDGRTPDLIAVIGTAPDGGFVNGYAHVDALTGPLPTTPEEAATWDPYPREVPVYAPDGVTQLGVFTVVG